MVFGKNKSIKNYYDILGVHPSATKEEIKVAYRKLSIKLHPDKNNDDHFFSEFFKNINEARDVLCDDQRRSEYDYKLARGSASENFKHKEDELRRKEEELLRRQQQMQEKPNTNLKTPSNNKEETGVDWKFVVNFLVIINLLLGVTIFATEPGSLRSKRTVAKQEQLTKPMTTTKKQNKTKIESHPIEEVSEQNNAEEVKLEVEKTEEVQAELPPEKVEKVQEDTYQPNEKLMEVVATEKPKTKKPGILQFRKRKEWKKEQKAKLDSL